MFFFFQAEDGIRYLTVTGVQTCALPILRTTMGWVGFKLNGHESFIPAGAICQTRPKIGPGTPYSETASASFRDALSRFDFESHTPAERNALLGILLVDARKDDALTLWHLLSRVSDAERPGEIG